MNTSQLQQFATDARTALMSAIEPRVREVLDPNSALHADNTAACKHLAHNAPSSDDRHAFDAYVKELTERYAYRWFNRIIAFRYMDVHGYTVTPVVSSTDMTNATALPEILAAARRGEYDERVFGPTIRTNEAIKQRVEAIFNGEATTADPQSTAYGLLMSAACNYWHTYLPFLFDEPNTIDDTIDRVLMPQNLLADGSPLREAIKAMTPENCGVGTTSGNVEIIGWLYQFYIAPRKDSVMAGFKKGKKAGAAEIPAATQLFTPEWIVRYLVQNTVGRLWMVNHPDCALAEGWEYYIAPTSDDDTAQLTVSSPEELTVCDPACGSGHMLTYAFDLLYEIYEDEGYAPSDIPGLILEHNLFGMEIDERAAQLAAFALTMKARGRSRRFFRKQVQPHIEQIKKIQFTEEEATELNELYDVTLPSETWNTYANADVFGSLIQPDTMLAAVSDNIDKSDAPTLYAPDLIERGDRVLEQTRYLSRTYATIVGNPPYMGGKNMSTQLKKYVEQHYPKGKSDLFAAFMLRCMHLVPQQRKDSVMAGFKKGKKAGAAEIPAATQLFTPEWIVRYLVQNTVGRLWMVNHPDCALAEGWEYYIAPTSDDDTAQLTVSSPEELTVCDPACGSGHMLTYAFDLLYEIYEDEGYAPSDIPGLILEHNLFGMEIDERAAQLAAFALTMKARGRSRRFFRKQVQPHIEQIKKIQFTEEEATELNELYDVTLPSETWNTYANADVFGSLIQPDTMLAAVSDNIDKSDAPTLYAPDLIERGDRVLEQTRYLSRTYATIVGNPPYMGGKNMSTQLKKYVEQHYPKGKSDLFAAFMLRCMHLVPQHGYLGFMTPYVWMFIHSYEDLRKQIIDQDHISSLIQLEYSGFDGATVPICTFVLQRGHNDEPGSYIRLSDFSGAKQQAPRTQEIITAHRMSQQNLPYEHAEMKEHFYEVSQQEFAQIPGFPIVYWLPESMLNTFSEGKPLKDIAEPRVGLQTSNNNRFVREWWEVSQNMISLNCDSLQSAAESGAKWFPYNKGGDFRKWYGNQEFVVNWANDGQEIRCFGTESGGRPRSRAQNTDYYFMQSVSWSNISSASPSFRYYPSGFIFSHVGDCLFENRNILRQLQSICNASYTKELLAAIAPTIHFEVGQIATLPIHSLSNEANGNLDQLIKMSREDWDSAEITWSFKTFNWLFSG